MWEKVVLQDKPDAGAFTFQVTLHQNGDIVFVYSVIPLMVEQIEDTAHPVKVGLSDAYIMDRIVFCKWDADRIEYSCLEESAAVETLDRTSFKFTFMSLREQWADAY